MHSLHLWAQVMGIVSKGGAKGGGAVRGGNFVCYGLFNRFSYGTARDIFPAKGEKMEGGRARG
jgi:hypothetical protein